MCERICEKIDIDGNLIYYEKVGNGEHKVLLLPGVLGSIQLDFPHQINGFDTDKFTIIGWEPPGYGNSRPPARTFVDWYKKDVDLVMKLMKNLEIERFSMIGFSDGGRTALLIAGQYPEMIEKLVVCGTSAYITPNERKTLTLIKDVSGWSNERQKLYEEVYGDEYSDIWSNWIDAFIKLNKIVEREVLEKIQCPTLVIHGSKDLIVACDPHAQYLKYNIRNSRLHIFHNTPHACHTEKPKEFNLKVKEFLLRKF